MSLGESIVLELCKAVFTAVFVAGGAALAVWWFQSIREDALRARDVERADRQRDDAAELQLAREQRSTKAALASRAADLAGSFYFLTQQRNRQSDDPDVWGRPDDKKFDDAYVAWATKAEAFQQELGVWYGWTDDVAERWHQVRDLLTIRYFTLRGRATPKLRDTNAREDDKMHSGLSAEELIDQDRVVKTYRTALPELLERMLENDVAV